MAGFTVTLRSALDESSPSLAVRRSTYSPAREKAAVVCAALAFAKVTEPGPLTLLQATVRIEPWSKNAMSTRSW